MLPVLWRAVRVDWLVSGVIDILPTLSFTCCKKNLKLNNRLYYTFS